MGADSDMVVFNRQNFERRLANMEDQVQWLIWLEAACARQIETGIRGCISRLEETNLIRVSFQYFQDSR